ncbi:hypothetical protein CEXT_121981 [Caerostris extrusa]|uniref:Uncharacterized protein n=1 Tax=Caerostris extrusa TaxID=172846 RepID=A0AAV4XQ69_CAEEX|nr:hypothetical protein CEXT_121981 [Caerostris extrusa]
MSYFETTPPFQSRAYGRNYSESEFSEAPIKSNSIEARGFLEEGGLHEREQKGEGKRFLFPHSFCWRPFSTMGKENAR